MSRDRTVCWCFFFFQAEDGIRDYDVTGVQTCALPICLNEHFDSLREEFPDLPSQVQADPEAIESAKEAFRGIEDSFPELRAKYLDQILPEAFALVKNAARRLVGETIQVCDQPIEWDMIHFDVQLIGGISLHRKMIAEMQTGEGKTLVATLPVFLNALTGLGVHVVTVNDYLARRDSEWMGAVFLKEDWQQVRQGVEVKEVKEIEESGEL